MDRQPEARVPLQETGTGMKRRGILAAAGAVVAGIVAKQAAQPVAASAAMLIANTETAGVSNSVVGPSTIVGGISFTSTKAMLIANAGTSPNALVGLHGTQATPPVDPPNPCGVFGDGGAVIGVIGRGVVGVAGIGLASGDATGVSGSGSGIFSGVGGTGGGKGGAGVIGIGGAQGTGAAPGAGVVGVANGAPNPGAGAAAGVYGSGGAHLGVLGTSSGSYGVLGVSTKPGFAGLTGITTTPSVPAFAGGSGVAGALAAQFSGGVYIDCTTVAGAQFVVNPMSAKFGTVQHHDGSLRLMASMEAPESWAVDIGEGQLSGGHASVQFEADFASVIEAHGYRVLLTPRGDTKGLYATNETATGFEVHEVQGGTSSVGFTWQVAAHPRAQKSERLKKYVAPVPLKLELPTVQGTTLTTPPLAPRKEQ